MKSENPITGDGDRRVVLSRRDEVGYGQFRLEYTRSVIVDTRTGDACKVFVNFALDRIDDSASAVLAFSVYCGRQLKGALVLYPEWYITSKEGAT